jgi:hypothetical protein
MGDGMSNGRISGAVEQENACTQCEHFCKYRFSPIELRRARAMELFDLGRRTRDNAATLAAYMLCAPCDAEWMEK